MRIKHFEYDAREIECLYDTLYSEFSSSGSPNNVILTFIM